MLSISGGGYLAYLIIENSSKALVSNVPLYSLTLMGAGTLGYLLAGEGGELAGHKISFRQITGWCCNFFGCQRRAGYDDIADEAHVTELMINKFPSH